MQFATRAAVSYSSTTSIICKKNYWKARLARLITIMMGSYRLYGMLHCCWRNAQTTHPRIFLHLGTAYVRDCEWLKPKHALHVFFLLLLSRWRSCRKHGTDRLRFSKEEKSISILESQERKVREYTCNIEQHYVTATGICLSNLMKKKRYSFLFARLII